jgi:hypothetical protein
MARKNTDITNSKKGMNKDSHISTLSEQEYAHAINTNTEEGVGQGMVMLQNEPSNLLCSNLPNGYKVIGHKVDPTSNKTYFFLVNNITNCSEIGVIPNLNNIINVDDAFQNCGCDINQVLAEPLENTVQIESCNYETLINDCSCENTNKCLNFNINYPISVVLKDEKCGEVLYITDDLNPRRRIEVNNIEQYFKETIPCETCSCGTEEVDVCLNCEKMLVQPNFSTPEISFEDVIGGNLRQGIYSFYIAYCDDNGNEMSRYMSVTPEIPIKDRNRNIYQQPELDARTNYSIKLIINRLDNRFKFYKIAVRQRVAVDGAIEYFETEVISTGQSEYIYTSESGKKRSSAELIGLEYPIYKTAKTNEATNNKLFYTDLTTQEEINLQPVVNFIGQFAKWRTVAAEETLFEIPEYAAKYKQYERDEVQPLSLRFFTDNGYYTANFPLISRIATEEDLYFDGFNNLNAQKDYIETLQNGSIDDLDDNWEKDIYSTLQYANNCSVEERYQKWQFYNTASVTRTSIFEDCGIELPFETREVLVERSCFSDIEEFTALDNTEFILIEDFEQGEQFTTLQDWLNYDRVNRIEILQDFPAFDPNTYASEFDCTDYCDLDTLFPCEGGADCCDVDSTPDTTIEFIGLDEGDIDIELVLKDCADYNPNAAPVYCNAYRIGGAGDIVNLNPCTDTCANAVAYEYSAYVGVANMSGTNTEKKNFVFERESSVSGSLDEQTPSVITLNTASYTSAHLSPIFPNLSYDSINDDIADYTDYATEVIETSNLHTDFYTENVFTEDLQRLKEKFCQSAVDYNNNNTAGDVVDKAYIDTEYRVHSNALWYEIDTLNETNDVIINFSKTTQPSASKESLDCLMYPKEYRVTIYKDTPSEDDSNHLTTVAVGLNGGIICISKTDVESSSKLIIAIDTPIAVIDGNGFSILDASYVTGSRGCFTISAQRPDILSLKYFGDTKIRLRQECAYSAVCTYKVFGEIKCEPIPWEEGLFSYWESTDTYPDNSFLYDSSSLNIDVNILPDSIKTEFSNIFISNNRLNENANFKCKPIRHFKFPDNAISPLHDGVAEKGIINQSFKSNKIYPLGVFIDNEVINAFLDIAVGNNLITLDFRNSIKGYEVFKGDMRLHRSIIAKGALYDMYKYEEKGVKNWFSNFPYNDLRQNELLYKEENRKEFIQHPFNGLDNIKFTFHSPETSFDKPTLPFELKVEGYYLGNSRGRFAEVNNHPTMVVLGNSAYKWATGLGTAEATLSLLLKISQALLDTSQTMFAGTGSVSYGVATAWVAFGLTTAQATVYFSTVDIFMKRYEWLKIFDENGTPYNFAAYYSSVGYYNSLSINVAEGQRLRGIKDRKYLGSAIYAFREQFENIKINQLKRESSVYISIGEDKDGDVSIKNIPLKHSNSYYNYDNSRTFTGQTGMCNASDSDKNSTEEVDRRLYAPYVSLKNYIPNQHSTIDSLQWIPTHYISYLNEDNKCDVIMGGDIFLSRFSFKRKFPFFLNAMVNESGALADFTPFNYTVQRNVGFPRFYLDYKSDMSKDFGTFEMPDIKSEYNFDCNYEKGLYYRPPSKFYLSYYGIPSFIVESRVNLNYRHGENNKEKDFYPNQTDYIAWTQENKVPISEDNYYFYRNLYSADNELYGYRKLPFNYDKDEWNCKSDHWDRTIYSEQDNNEQDNVDAFRVFRANNYYDFGNRFGKIYMLKNIESERVIGLFENGAVIFNSFNTLEGSVESIQIGNGNLFKTRPTEFFKSELGYAGTQNRQFVSCEYGHFWVDAKRGRVHSVSPNGEGLDEVSRYGMRNWFRDNLPFNILKKFPNMETDNTFKSIGITMCWDSRYNRVFITKKDAQLKKEWEDKIEYRDDEFRFIGKDEVVDINDEKYFIDKSWTVAYNPLLKSWVSFYTFTPNYYIAHNNYFQSGINADTSSLWSHLLTNRSYQVFYGKKATWKVELPLKNSPIKKWYESIEYKLDVRRFSNEFDFNYRDGNFNKAIIYTNRESTGLLNLVTGVPNNMKQYLEYPKLNNNSWDIIVHNEDQTWNINTLFDLIKDNHQQPLFYNTPNNADKKINDSAFNYKPTIKNRLRGEYASIILEQDKETRFKFILEYLTNTHNNYQS